MARHTYRMEAQDHGRWVVIMGEVGLEYGRGWLAHHRQLPGPRLAIRLVRSDGREVDSVSRDEEASIGMHAGTPTADDYRAAAARCIERAVWIEAQEAAREARRAR